MKKWFFTVFLVFFAPAILAAEQGALFSFNDGKAIHLRWNAPLQQSFAGFYVERRVNGADNWTRLNTQPVKRIEQRAEIRRILGADADNFLTFFDPSLSTISQDDFAKLGRDPFAGPMLQLFSIKNPTFAKVLGETFSDTSLQVDQTFFYRVILLSPQGGEQVWASSMAVSHSVIGRISVPEDVVGKAQDSTALVNWHHAPELSRSGALVSYRVYRADKPFGPFVPIHTGNLVPTKVDGKLPEFLVADGYLSNGKDYWYQITGINLLGFESTPSETIKITPKDQRPPRSPELSAKLLREHGLLTWAPVVADDLAGYRVYRSTQSQGPYEDVWPGAKNPARNVTNFLDTQLLEGQRAYYYVRAEDQSENVSIPSNVVELIRLDLTPPSQPVGVVAEGSDRGISLSWAANNEADLLGYLVKRTTRITGKGKDTRVGDRFFTLHAEPLQQLKYLDKAPETSQSRYAYHVIAVDHAWNQSEPSVAVIARMPDKTPPGPPSLVDARLNADTVTLRWLPSFEEDLKAHNIYRQRNPKLGFKLIASVDNPSATTAQDKPEGVGETIVYRITAVDLSGNESEPSPSLRVLMLDLMAPPTATNLKATQQDGAVHLGWVLPEPDAVLTQWVYRKQSGVDKFVLIAELTNQVKEFIDDKVTVDTLYEYVIRVGDEHYNVSEPSKTVAIEISSGRK